MSTDSKNPRALARGEVNNKLLSLEAEAKLVGLLANARFHLPPRLTTAADNDLTKPSPYSAPCPQKHQMGGCGS